MNHPIITDLEWRYATKKFDPQLRISEENMDILKRVLQLAPSSYGLQPYKFLLIENQAIRQKLRISAHGQSPVTDASHLILFCVNTDLGAELVESHVRNTAAKRALDPDVLEPYEQHLKISLNKMTAEEQVNWASRQAYIALGHLVQTAAQLKIDAIPLEGFEKQEFDEILQLKEKNLHALVACALGYRAEDDRYQHLAKVRRQLPDLFEII